MQRNKESFCPIIQDLLPIYADGELSKASSEMVQNHLEECPACLQELEEYKKPLFTDIPAVEEREYKATIFSLWPGLRRVAWIGILALLIGTGSLVYASYNMGKSVALQDPTFQRAIKEDLFIAIHQTKSLGPYEVTITRLLLDNAQTVVFYNTYPALSTEDRINLTIKDQEGRTFEPFSTLSYSGKEHVSKLAPTDPLTQELNLEFTLEDTPAAVNFTIAVDPTPILASTNQWWPGITKEIGPVRVDLEHAVLGITKSQMNIRALWPLDENIRGIGFSIMSPLGPKIGGDGQVISAGAGVFNIRKGYNITGEYGTLVDTLNKRQLELMTIRYQTDSFTGGINASFEFEPLKEHAAEIEFTLPYLYLYHYVQTDETIEISLEDGEEISPTINLGTSTQEVILENVSLQDSNLTVNYTIPANDQGYVPKYLPELVLITDEGIEMPGRIRSIDGTKGVVEFYFSGDESAAIRLESMGEILQKDSRYELQVPTGF